MASLIERLQELEASNKTLREENAVLKAQVSPDNSAMSKEDALRKYNALTSDEARADFRARHGRLLGLTK